VLIYRVMHASINTLTCNLTVFTPFQVVVMRKRDFMDLDNPLLAWMLDYDAVSACLRVRGRAWCVCVCVFVCATLS